jgi:hypothetical protein
MKLCAVLLEMFDTKVLGPLKMQEGEEEKGLQALERGLVGL